MFSTGFREVILAGTLETHVKNHPLEPEQLYQALTEAVILGSARDVAFLLRLQRPHMYLHANLAVAGDRAHILRLLVSQYSTLNALDTEGRNLLEAVGRFRRPDCERILVANGAWPGVHAREELHVWERIRKHRKAMAIAFLGLKRRRPAHLARIDRFLLREIALAVWATREE